MNTNRLASLLFVCAAMLTAANHGRAAAILVADLRAPTWIPAPTTSVGDPRPQSFGTATFVLNDEQTALMVTATVFNIDVTGSQTADTNDNLISAHIHAAAIIGQVAQVRWGFFGVPDNDNNPDDLILTPFSQAVGGTFSTTWDATEGAFGTTLLAQINNLLEGSAYIDFHTVQFPDGPGPEIRGQIVPEPVPTMAVAGVIALFAARRRRKTGGQAGVFRC